MSNVRSIRLRLSLLATSSAFTMGIALGVGALATLSPTAALAQCGVPSGGAVSCAPGTYPTGIAYPTVTPLTVTLQQTPTAAVVTTTGGVAISDIIVGDSLVLNRAFTGTPAAGSAAPSITNLTGPAISVTGVGLVTVDLTAPTTDTGIVVTGSTNGIVASSTSTIAPVSVILTTGSVTGQAGYGIDAAANGGALSVSSGTASVTGTIGAINATQFGGTGAVTVTANGALNATAGDAVTATISNAGNANTVQVNVGGAITASGNGVNASTAGTGAVVINQTAGDIEQGANGLVATTTSGAITITQSGTIGATAPIGVGAGNNGIEATSTTGPITITANSINTGGEGVLVTSTSGNVIVNTTAGGLVQAEGDGIAVTTGGAGTITVNVHGNITGDTNAGGFGDGVTLTSGSGAIVVNTDAGTVIQALAAPNAINITSASGAVTLTSHSNLSTPFGGPINVTTGGAGTITVSSSGQLSGSGNGIAAASTGTGAVTVTNTGAIGTSGAHIGGDGLLIKISDAASAATLSVNDSGNIYASGPYGVAALNLGTGATIVTMGNGTAATPLIVDPSVYGVYSYTAGGPATGTAGNYNNYVVGAAGTAGNAGLYVQSGAGADPVGGHSVTASLGSNDVITVAGNDSVGVTGNNNFGPTGTGSVVVTTGSNNAITVSGSRSGGVYGFTNGVGAVNVTVGTGSITVNEVGVIGAGVTARNFGIDAESVGGPTTVSNASTINVTGSATDTSYGIFASSGLGSVSASSSGAITSNNGFGIRTLTTTGANTVSVTGNVTASPGAASTGIGVDASANTGPVNVTVGGASNVTGGFGVIVTGSGTTAVTNSGTIVGTNTSVGDAVEFVSSGAETLTNNAGGTLTGPGLSTNSATVYANNTGGTLTINNSGLINSAQANHLGVAVGVVGTGGLTVNNDASGVIDGRLGTANGHFAFNNAGTWTTNGGSTFGSVASAATNVLTNSGTVAAGLTGTNATPAASLSTTTFTNLGAFNNSGLMTMQNGLAGDNLTTTGAYAGSGGATLAVDLRATTTTPVVDTFTIGGAATGSTAVALNLVGGPPGLVNGTTVITGGAGSSATAFSVAPSSVNQGFIHYALVYNGAGAYQLYGTPNAAAYETALLGEQQHNLWYVTEEAWSDHLAELRDASSAGDGTVKDGVHSWAIFNGGETDRDANRSFTVFGQTNTYGLGYKQDYLSGEVGVDTVSSFWGGQTVWGLTAGYAQGNGSFNTTGDASEDKIYNVGLYAGWVSGGLFINALVKYDGGTMSVSGYSPGYTTSQNLSETGGTIELGYRFGAGGGWWFEPVGSISYVSGQSHDFTALGSTFHFSDDDSSRGKLGIMTGTTVPIMSGAKLVPYFGVNAVDEFQGQDHVTFTNAGTTLVFNNQRPSTFGQADLGLDLIAANGFTSFFQAHGDFGGDMTGYGARIGVRWRW